jgi:hypothetical protein
VRLIPFRKPKKRIRKNDKFVKSWTEIHTYCKDKATWSNALIEADKLLDKALKKRKFKGHSMGARLVSAQRYITDNDDLWDAHNLVKKLMDDPSKVRLKETNVKEALISFREGLKDLGALPSNKEHGPKAK